MSAILFLSILLRDCRSFSASRTSISPAALNPMQCLPKGWRMIVFVFLNCDFVCRFWMKCRSVVLSALPCSQILSDAFLFGLYFLGRLMP